MSAILCCGMIRSGSTVLYQIASAIVELRGIGERAGYYEPPHRSPERPRGGWAVNRRKLFAILGLAPALPALAAQSDKPSPAAIAAAIAKASADLSSSLRFRNYLR